MRSAIHPATLAANHPVAPAHFAPLDDREVAGSNIPTRALLYLVSVFLWLCDVFVFVWLYVCLFVCSAGFPTDATNPPRALALFLSLREPAESSICPDVVPPSRSTLTMLPNPYPRRSPRLHAYTLTFDHFFLSPMATCMQGDSAVPVSRIFAEVRDCVLKCEGLSVVKLRFGCSPR